MKKIAAITVFCVVLCSCVKTVKTEHHTIKFENQSLNTFISVGVKFENGKGSTVGALAPGSEATGLFLPGPFEGVATVHWMEREEGKEKEFSEKVSFDRSKGQNSFLIIFTESGLMTSSSLDDYDS